MTLAIVLATIAGAGAYFLLTPPHERAGEEKRSGRPASTVADWLTQAGIAKSAWRQVATLSSLILLVGTFGAWLMVGGVVAPLIAGAMLASLPYSSLRARRRRRLLEAADAWPRMIDEIRMLCGSLGKPIPQALLEVGKKGPQEYRQAFHEAEREWLLSTDFNRSLNLLRSRLADPTADIVCETLAIAHSIGGTDVNQRLDALARDRHADLQSRKDARSKQAGVIFARRFVLIVPLGMAFVGMSIGDGRAAYASGSGQVAIAMALMLLGGCWLWAGHLIRLPEPKRAFRA